MNEPNVDSAVADLLALPDLEREKVYNVHPNARNMVENFLANNSDFTGLPDEEKNVVRQRYGLKPIEKIIGLNAPFPQVKPTNVDVMKAEGAVRDASLATDTSMFGKYRRLYEDYVAKPIQQEYFYGPEKDTTFGKIVRGVVAGNPLLAPSIPSTYQQPEFFSIENAAKLATDTLITLPLFQVAAGARIGVAAAEAFQFFTRFPGVARFVAEAATLGGADAAYRKFVEATSDLVRDGHTNIPTLLKEFPQAWGQATAFMLGLGGIGHGIAAGYRALIPVRPGMVTGGINEATRAMGGKQPFGQAPIPPAAPIPTPPTPPIPQAAGNAATLNAAARMQTSRLTEAEKLTFGTPPFPIPGFLQTAEQKLRGYPAPHAATPEERAAIEHATEATLAKIKPNGEIEASVPEEAIKLSFIATKDAIPGDFVYANGKIVRVEENLAGGLRVRGERGSYFVKHDKVTGKANVKFRVGEEVLRPNGEPVVVRGYTPEGKVWVRDNTGRLTTETQDRLISAEQKLAEGEQAERLAAGIEGPSPSGTSVFDLFTNERGSIRLDPTRSRMALRKRTQDDEDIASGNLIPIAVSTQPMDGANFGLYRYYLDPVHTLLRIPKQEYALAAKLILDSTNVEAQFEKQALTQMQGLKKLVGSNEQVSQKLMRFAVGVQKAGETLTAAEQTVLDTWRQFGQQHILPAVNMRRQGLGLQPVAPDYNYILHLFPEIVLTHGYNGTGLAKNLANAMTILGRDNEVALDLVKLTNSGADPQLLAGLALHGNNSVKINVQANFWEVADRLVKFASQEIAWRNTIEYVRGISGAETSPSNKKWLLWLTRSLEGKQTSPAISDLTTQSYWVDKKIGNIFGTKSSAELDIGGKRYRFDVPPVSVADLDLRDVAMGVKKLTYANLIGGNLRTSLVNLTQPITHVLPQLPGNPLRNTTDMLAAYISSASRVLSKKALAEGRQRGIIHDAEDLFTPTSAVPLTSVTGNPMQNMLFAKDWVANNFWAATFLNMRGSEIINRTAGWKVSRDVFAREAGKRGFAIDDPEFARQLNELATVTTNMSNFLYGKGFKSPLQESLGFGLDSPIGKAIGAPLGELLYQFNTFSVKTWGMASILWGQAWRGGPSYVERLLSTESSDDFVRFMESIRPSQRATLLRALTYTTLTASLLSTSLGMASLWWSISPIGQLGFNPITPSIKAVTGIAKDMSNLNFGKAVGTAVRDFMPLRNMMQRFSRGGGALDQLFATRSDVEQKTPIGAVSGPGQQIQEMFGPSTRETRR